MKSASSSVSGKKIRYAVIGLGHIAQVAILPGFAHAKNSELAALVSDDPAKLKKLARKYGLKRTFRYEEFDRCLADDSIDAVYIALPNDLHCDYALRSAAAGKHILCEKPLAGNLRDARLMTQSAKENDVRLMTAYRLHYEPATLSAIALVRSGKLGETRYFTSSFSYQLSDGGNIRLQAARSGGPIFDIGIYCLNAARHLMDDEPIEVSAFFGRTGDKRFVEVEESAAVLLRFPRGRLASFVVSFGASGVSHCQLVGTKGSVLLDPAFAYAEGLKQVVMIGGKSTTKTFPQTDQFGGEIEAFSQCILKKRQPEPSGEEGIADLNVIEAIFESACTGRAVRLQPFRRTQRPSRRQEKRKPAVRRPPQVVGAQGPHD